MKTTDRISNPAKEAGESRHPFHRLFQTPPLGVIYAIGLAIVLLQLRSIFL